jgi:hypothetical protein
MTRKKTTVLVVVVAVVVLGVLGYVLSRLGRVAVAGLAGAVITRFPPVDWSDEPFETIAAADPDALDAHWQTLQCGLADPGSVDGFVRVATLTLPTGCLLATDVNFVEDNRPFRRPVPPGRYPVYGFRSSTSIVAAVLIAPDQSPTAWVVADMYGDTRAQLQQPNGLWGISLDSSAIFVDAIVCRKQSTFNPWPIFKQTTNSVVVDQATGANAVCVDLGGVGVHKVYWGLDGASQPIVLLAVVD